jgi:predicted metal-dependent phosphoesterase TrpH
MIDLHLHTTASDGIYSLEQIVKKAEDANLSAIAITDHDTIKSAERIHALNSSIEVIPGIELSVYDNALGYMDLHVIGLFLDVKSPKLLATLSRLSQERDDQKKAIISKLNQLGYEIKFEDAKKFSKASLGRPHIAKALIEKYPNEFQNIPQVFEKLLDAGKPAFQERSNSFSLEDAINVIHAASGKAILAHPFLFTEIRSSKYDLEKLLNDFKKLGGDGIESVYDYATNYQHYKYTSKDNERTYKILHAFAKQLDLLESGGSDYHAPGKGPEPGTFGPPDEFLQRLKSRS